MNGYLLDTDILISFLRGKNEKLKKNIHAILEKRFYIGFSVISLGELYLGVFKSQNPPKNQLSFEKWECLLKKEI